MARKLEIQIVGDTRDYERALAKASKDTQGFGKSAEGASKSLGGMGKTAQVAAVAGIGALAVGAKKAIDAASDLNEQVSKAGVVFGKSGTDVTKWAGGLAHDFGMSKRAALEAAGTFGNMLVPMGFARTTAAGMSKTFVQLAGDMASFNNASPEVTLEALRAGLAGETEPLRKFGVFLNENRVKLEAVSSGLVKAEVDHAKLRLQQLKVTEATKEAAKALHEHGKSSMEYAKAQAQVDYEEGKAQKLLEGKIPPLTAAQKAQATYNVIMKDTIDTQGDFARTSGSVANQQRIQAAETENLEAALGRGLLPVWQTAQKLLISLTDVMSEHTTIVQIAVGLFATLAGTVLAVNAATKVFAATTKVAAAAQWAFNIAAEANPYVLLATAIVALVAGIVLLLKHFHLLDNVWNALVTAGKTVANFFTNTLGGVIDWIKDHWINVLLILFGGIPGLLFTAIQQGWIAKFLAPLQGVFNTVVTWIKDHWVDIIVVLVGGLPGLMWVLFGKNLEAVFVTPFKTAWTAVSTWVKDHWVDVVVGLVGGLPALAFKKFMDTWGSEFVDKLHTAFTNVGTWINQEITRWAGHIAALPGKIADFGAELLAKITSFVNSAGIGKFLSDKVTAFANLFESLPRAIGAAIGGAIGDLKAALTRIFDWHKILGWIEDALDFHSPAPWAVEIGKGIVASIADGVGGAAGVLKDAVFGLAKDAIASIPGAVGGAVSAVGGAIGGAVGGVVGGPTASTPVIAARNYARSRLSAFGWGQEQWPSLLALWQGESGWNSEAINPSSHAGGIPQALPATKMGMAAVPKGLGGGGDYKAQIDWGLGYIKGRADYGSPAAAYAAWQSRSPHWYAKGGIFTRPSIIGVGEKGPEAVVPLSRVGGGPTIVVNVAGSVTSERQLHDTIYRELVRRAGRNAGNMGFMPR
jgi:uncharacterized membrane protein YqaE (UPF0057 family)